MKEQLILFETAKLAKEKGFLNSIHYDGMGGYFTNTTQSLLQKWLREEHNIEVWVTPTHLSYINNKLYKVEIEYFNGKRIHCFKHDEFKTYEEALEKGLQEALKLIK